MSLGSKGRSVASVTCWALRPRYLGRAPVLANRGGACQPRAEFGLRELRVAVLEPDAVGVALAKVCDQHLARVLVLPALGNLKMDLEKAVVFRSKTRWAATFYIKGETSN